MVIALPEEAEEDIALTGGDVEAIVMMEEERETAALTEGSEGGKGRRGDLR